MAMKMYLIKYQRVDRSMEKYQENNKLMNHHFTETL